MKGEALLVMGLPCAQRQEKLQFCQSDSDAFLQFVSMNIGSQC